MRVVCASPQRHQFVRFAAAFHGLLPNKAGGGLAAFAAPWPPAFTRDPVLHEGEISQKREMQGHFN